MILVVSDFTEIFELLNQIRWCSFGMLIIFGIGTGVNLYFTLKSHFEKVFPLNAEELIELERLRNGEIPKLKYIPERSILVHDRLRKVLEIYLKINGIRFINFDTVFVKSDYSNYFFLTIEGFNTAKEKIDEFNELLKNGEFNNQVFDNFGDFWN